MSVTLYRAVSQVEGDDIRRTGRLRPTVNSLEGKHFASSAVDARQWGAQPFGGAAFRVVAVQIEERQLEEWVYWERLDGIGPAYFADEAQLIDCIDVSVLDD